MEEFFGIAVVLVIVTVVICFRKTECRQEGKDSENWVSYHLHRLKPGNVIDDLTLQIDTDKTSQIDHLFICRKGIFVIETKSHTGKIYGLDNQRHWQSYYHGKKYNFHNPVKQNAGHMYAGYSN